MAQHYSGIGGQAVLEGVMMRNKNMYATAVRKPNQEIEVEVDEFHGAMEQSFWKKLPLVRGVFSFVDSLALGIRTLNYSASFYDEEEPSGKRIDPDKKARQDKALEIATTTVSLIAAIFLFMVLPYLISSLLERFIRSTALLSIVEGLIRILIFLTYMVTISLMPDIKRLYRYHGAEHKCINCIEHGHALTVANVRKASRFHRRCGTSFIVFVMLISVVLFFFIHVDSFSLRILIRIALIPVIAGISYEILRLAGRSDNIAVRIMSAPGLFIQRITTAEPDDAMIEVAITSVEAVFDWKAYLADEFGKDERRYENVQRGHVVS